MNVTGPAFQVSEIQEHLLRSDAVAQIFRIRVFLPVRRADDSERFPVLYATDADDFFGGLASMANMLQVHGETPRFILVGIGYEEARAAPLLRMRDLCTHPIRAHFQTMLEQMVESPLLGGAGDLNQVIHTTDAKDFLRFIRSELMPFINERYPTLPDDNSYYGHSAGGTFGLYTLFSQPDVFCRYVLGSPATSYDGHHFGIELARAFIESGRKLEAKVFMSVGELEELKRGMGSFDFVTGYYLLAKFLTNSPIRGLDLTLRMFPGETHVTAWTAAFIHGLKALFGPVDQVPYWPKFLK